MQHMYSAIANKMFCSAILQDEEEHTIYRDLKRKVPIGVYTCMNYIYIRYVYKLNTILLRTMENREDEDLHSMHLTTDVPTQ